MKKLILSLFLIPAALFAAAGDIKIDRKNSSDNAWIASIFAKQNNSFLATDSTGVPSIASNLTWSSTGVQLSNSATTGLQLYNTSDQTTNYERLESLWSSNVGTIRTTSSGTGVVRALALGTGNGQELRLDSASSGFFRLRPPGTAIAGSIGASVISSGNWTQTSGSNVGFTVGITYNQASGNAANTDFLVNRIETLVGSGTQLLGDFQVGGTSRFSVSNLGVLSGVVGSTNVVWTLSQGATGRVDFSANAGSSNYRINALSTTIAGGDTILTGALATSPQSLSGAGAINITTTITQYTSTGVAQALTLANATTVGQHKIIVHSVDGGSGVLTPTTKIGFTAITFTNVGDSVSLVYTAAGWAIVGIFGAVAA
jgi:hypothetical protein